MKITIAVISLLAVLALYHSKQPELKVKYAAPAIHATWTGSTFTCPAGTDIWASEDEALSGNDEYAYCTTH